MYIIYLIMLLLSTLTYQAALLHQQREDRRKARLLEVREQERSFAKKVRDNVRTKKQEERRAMEEHLQAMLAASQEAELRELEAHYQARQKQIGQGHRQAQHVTQVIKNRWRGGEEGAHAACNSTMEYNTHK